MVVHKSRPQNRYRRRFGQLLWISISMFLVSVINWESYLFLNSDSDFDVTAGFRLKSIYYFIFLLLCTYLCNLEAFFDRGKFAFEQSFCSETRANQYCRKYLFSVKMFITILNNFKLSYYQKRVSAKRFIFANVLIKLE